MKHTVCSRRRIRSESGVSPVIGVILLVTITVVLVSVIWTTANMFMPNFSGSPKVSLRTENAGLSETQMRVIVNYNEKNDVSYDVYKVALYRNGSVESIPASAVKTGILATGSEGCIIKFSDEGDKMLSAGDWFLISGMKTGSLYEFYVFYYGNAVGTAKWNT